MDKYNIKYTNKYNKYNKYNKIVIFFGILLLCALLLSVFIITINQIIIAYRKSHSKPPTSIINNESFATNNKYISSILIYTNNIPNSSWISSKLDPDIEIIYKIITNNTSWTNIKTFLNKNDSKRLLNTNITPQFPISYICTILDTYELSQLNTMKSNLITTQITAPQGYFVAFSTPQKAKTFECSLDLGNKSIGYFGFDDEIFINAILNGHRIDMNSVTKKLIDYSNLASLTTSINTIDIFITYIIPGTDFHKLLLKQRITFIGFSNMDIARVSLFYPGLTMANNIDISKTFLELPPPNNSVANTATVTQKENITNLPTMTHTFLMMEPKMVFTDFTNNNNNNPNVETFVSRLNLPDTYLDPTYTCYGDITANIKALCDSAYDIVGEPKTQHTTWDHSCIVDTDCPYYQANTNYENNRGGCMDSGVCELPIGVRRVSYRKYDDEDVYAPYCYGCDAYDTECCNTQQNPDYAFAGDTDERKAIDANLPISIPMKF